MPRLRSPQREGPPEGPGTTRFDPSLNSFFNAVLKETDLGRFQAGRGRATFAIDLGEARLHVPCAHRSQAGRHGLRGPCFEEDADGRIRRLTFPEAARKTLSRLEAEEADRRRLLQRVLRSRRNLDDAVEDRTADLDDLFAGALGFAEAEQALLAGHSLHPCPKDRGGLGRHQARRWAACHAPSFPLAWVAAPRDRVRSFTERGVDTREPVAGLAEADDRLAAWREALADEEMLIPCHPFQLDHWRAHPRLASGFADGTLRVLGESSLRWRPTSSVRTLHNEEAEWGVKFSLSLQLTNSLRHLHVEELARGPRITSLLSSSPARSLRSRFPRLRLLDEPASLALTDEEGRPVEASGIAWRRDPFPEAGERRWEPLATLLQDDPRDGESRLVKRLRAHDRDDAAAAIAWFEAFLDVAVRPFLVAHGDHGLLFSAHQQNLVLGLKGIEPTAAAFRDCQGVGFSPLGRRRFADRIERWPEDVALVFDRDTSAKLVAYYVVVNAAFNAIASLAASGWVDETELLERLVGHLEELRAEGLEDDTLVHLLLEAPELPLKGNLHYALHGVDETTQDRHVLDLYRPIPNPLAEVRS